MSWVLTGLPGIRKYVDVDVSNRTDAHAITDAHEITDGHAITDLRMSLQYTQREIYVMKMNIIIIIIITQVLLATQLSWIDITIGYN